MTSELRKSQVFNPGFAIALLASLIGLIACQAATPNRGTPSPTLGALSLTTDAVPTASPTPQPNLQLTFFSDPIASQFHHNVYGINVDCLAEQAPCFASPIPLLELDLDILAFSWSPDGQQIAVSAMGLDDRADIYVADWNGSNAKNITNSPEQDDHPAWSPDGAHIAYETCVYEGCHIYVSDPDGTNRRQLLTAAATRSPRAPAWAPSGQQITFVDYSPQNAYEQIFVANLDGSGLVQLTDQPTVHFAPAFSPDGLWLAFAWIRDADSMTQSEILLLNTDSLIEQNLTKGGVSQPLQPAWSPIGDWLAVDGNENKKGDVFIISQHGAEAINATHSLRAHCSHPAWRLTSMP